MTLSETLVTIFIVALLATMVTGIYITYVNVFKLQIVYNELSTNNTLAIDRISANLKGAIQVVSSRNIGEISYSSGPQTLILQLPSINSSQNIVEGEDYIFYYLDGQKLTSYFEPGLNNDRPANTQVVADFVKTLVFNYNNLDYTQINKVEIIMESSKSVNVQTREVISQTTVELRNK